MNGLGDLVQQFVRSPLFTESFIVNDKYNIIFVLRILDIDLPLLYGTLLDLSLNNSVIEFSSSAV